MHQHSFVLNCSQWVPCWGMWIWMAPLFWRLNCNYPDVIGNVVLTLPSKTVFLYLCMAPMVHLLSYTQSNLFGSQTPMSHPENREERTLLPSNQWNITALDKSNQYCSKYWTLRWWKNPQSHVHNSSTLSFPTLSSKVKLACVLTISRDRQGGRGQCAEFHSSNSRKEVTEGWVLRSLEPLAHLGSAGWTGVRSLPWVLNLLVSGQSSLKLKRPRSLWQLFIKKSSRGRGT